jgi:hypothetical protein
MATISSRVGNRSPANATSGRRVTRVIASFPAALRLITPLAASR